jgi:uncharacterized membrane protein YagU involved in acid resistance
MASTPLGGATGHTSTLGAARSILAGVGAGLAGGIVFGAMMTMMNAPTPDGGSMPMMGMVGKIVGSPTLPAGWLYHLFNSAIIGAVFGWLLGGRVVSYSSGAVWGALYGAIWWVLGGLILMPLLLGMPPLAPFIMPGMLMVGMGSLIGHLVYGVLTGLAFKALADRI